MKIKYLQICACLAVVSSMTAWSKSERFITRFDDATHAKIGAMTGTTGEALVAKRFPEAQLKSFDDIMDAVIALKSGQLDAIVTSFPLAFQISKTNPDLGTLPESLDNEDTAIALKKGNDELLASLNRIITELKRDGTLESMKKRWFKADFSPYQEMDIPLPTEGNVLRIGVSATREPFSFVDKDGRVTGHDGELARMISAKLQRPIEFSNMKFSALLPALQSGKIDLIVTGMTATDERKKKVDFTQPYFINAQVMLVKKSTDRKLTSATDLSDKRIGVMLGTVHDTYAMEHFPKATILQYKSPSDLILAVKSGKVDAAMYTRESMLVILRDDHALGLLGDSLFTSPMGMGFSKGNDQFRSSFNQFLGQIKQNGVYDDMVNRWIKTGCLQMPEIAQGKTDGVLVVGNVSDKGLPFTVVKDNQLIGFDIELSKRFAAAIGKEIKFADMEFGSLIAALVAGKINMIASTLIITEERKKKVDFSDIYYEINATFFALKERIASTEAVTDSAPASISFFKGISNSFQSNIIQENRYLLILDGLKTTVIISVLAAVFGTLLGALVCFMRMSKKASLNLPAKIYISVLRGIPVLVLLMITFYVIFASININPVLVAVIAFGMNFAAYSAEIFRTGILGVDRGQTEAGHSLGFTKVSTFLHIVLPQTVRRILPVYKGEFISLVKMTSIVGYIAVQDLTKASDIIRSRTFDAFFPLIMVAILYFAVSWFLMQGLEYLERRTDPKQRRRKRGAL